MMFMASPDKLDIKRHQHNIRYIQIWQFQDRPGFRWAVTICLSIFLTDVECTCNSTQFYCQTQEGKYGMCVNGICTVIREDVREDLTININVKYPEEKLQVSLRIKYRLEAKKGNLGN